MGEQELCRYMLVLRGHEYRLRVSNASLRLATAVRWWMFLFYISYQVLQKKLIYRDDSQFAVVIFAPIVGLCI